MIFGCHYLLRSLFKFNQNPSQGSEETNTKHVVKSTMIMIQCMVMILSRLLKYVGGIDLKTFDHILIRRGGRTEKKKFIFSFCEIIFSHIPTYLSILHVKYLNTTKNLWQNTNHPRPNKTNGNNSGSKLKPHISCVPFSDLGEYCRILGGGYCNVYKLQFKFNKNWIMKVNATRFWVLILQLNERGLFSKK